MSWDTGLRPWNLNRKLFNLASEEAWKRANDFPYIYLQNSPGIHTTRTIVELRSLQNL